jgi:acyl-CoA-binding protein
MVNDIQSRFDQAVAASKSLPERPDNATLLRLYSLYKQAVEGDVAGERPGMTDFVARAKWDSWKSQEGKDSDAARQEYVALVESLIDD